MAKAPRHWDLEADVVVVGSGSGALNCAIRTHDLGGKAIVLERSSKLGGGTAYSAGLMWMPNNYHMAELGLRDSREEALTYLKAVSGGKHSAEVVEAYVDNCDRAIRYLEEHVGLHFEVMNWPDYYAEWPGGKSGGRYIAPTLFDAKQLGEWQTKVRTSPHIPFPFTHTEIKKWGGTLNFKGWDWDLLGERIKEDIRGLGSGLICCLVKACLDRGCPMHTDTRARQLFQDSSGHVVGVRAEKEGHSLNIRGHRGVLLACGGFEWNKQLKALHTAPDCEGHTPPTNEGDGMMMGMEVGAAVTLLQLGIGLSIVIPGEEHEGRPLHRILFPRWGAPGSIIVNRSGKRFCNESFWRSFSTNVCHFDGLTLSYPNAPCYAIFDQRHKDTYAMGPCMPGEEAPGWITSAPTLEELARRLGIDPANLAETVATFNTYAREGKDLLFHRGDSLFDRGYSGDPSVEPNPCLYPLEKPPFYGFEIHLGTGATTGGLIIDGKSRVKSWENEVIPGLYACPNTAAHLVEGMGLFSGSAVGPSTVFGFLAAEHAMGASAC